MFNTFEEIIVGLSRFPSLNMNSAWPLTIDNDRKSPLSIIDEL